MIFNQKRVIIHKLMNTRSHLGSTQKVAYSYFQSYLYGFRNEMNIINLEITLTCLKRVCYVIENIVNTQGHILFINTNPEYNEMVKYTSFLSKQSVVNHKWTGGLLTNWNHMQYVLSHFQSIFTQFTHPKKTTRLNQKKNIKPSGEKWDKVSFGKNGEPQWISSKVAVSRVRSSLPSAQNTLLSVLELPRFRQMKMCFEGLRATSKQPDCVILFNGTQNANAINEAYKLNIPIISLVDSNMENKLLSQITYPIPANENSMEFIYLLCNCILKTLLQKKTTQIGGLHKS